MQELNYRYPEVPYQIKRGYISRMFSAFLAIIGGLCVTALLCRTIESAATSWSPTGTAQQCFYYPLQSIASESLLPDREAASQLLLSAAFFGNDALYFDAGEENTGTSELQAPDPADISGIETPHKPITEPEIAIPEGTDIYAYDYSKLATGELALLPYPLSGGADHGEVLLSNTTAHEIDIEASLNADYPIEIDLDNHSADEPLILILHTHGTEAFSPEGATSCLPTAVQRSSNIEENIVAVGAVMAQKLNEAGIPTLHCETMHDLESYQRSYNLAADTIQKYLTEYPSIKYVFDVHRDAIVRTSGDLIRPLTVIDGKLAAQVMLLVGTDEKGADHPNWLDNFSIAAKLQSKLTSTYDKFARPINIRGASFNEQFTPGSLLIEIGSAGNTLSEAKNAAEHLTYSIIDLIKENSK